MAQKILKIAAFWPESKATASGLRNNQLISCFLSEDYDVHFASTAKPNVEVDRLNRLGVKTHSVLPNDSEFQKLVALIQPDFVIFDQFLIEEQFSWRVREASPHSLLILDTQDLHFLRRYRQERIDQGSVGELVMPRSESKACDTFLRELAAIHRADLGILVSDVERDFLVQKCNIGVEKLVVVRLLYSEPVSLELLPSFDARRDFCLIGNFRHPPNADSVRWFHSSIWPRVREKLPEAEVFVFGAYMPAEFLRLNSPSIGFHVRGFVDDHLAQLRGARVNLAPLRFGAGVKGKIADGWASGTPCVSTLVGAEGMTVAGRQWGGAIANDPEAFAKECVKLYTEAAYWKQLQFEGASLLNLLFSAKEQGRVYIDSLKTLAATRALGQPRDLISEMLWHQSLRATEYFSRWIELKSL